MSGGTVADVFVVGPGGRCSNFEAVTSFTQNLNAVEVCSTFPRSEAARCVACGVWRVTCEAGC
eukprot:3225959-Rhodomonas_salina.3